jgi:hypothetical protein
MSVGFFPDGKTIVQGLQEDNITLYTYPDNQPLGKLDDTKNTT